MRNFRTMSTSELKDHLEFIKIDPKKFKDEIEEIEQELIIRKFKPCRPVIDFIREAKK